MYLSPDHNTMDYITQVSPIKLTLGANVEFNHAPTTVSRHHVTMGTILVLCNAKFKMIIGTPQSKSPYCAILT